MGLVVAHGGSSKINKKVRKKRERKVAGERYEVRKRERETGSKSYNVDVYFVLIPEVKL